MSVQSNSGSGGGSLEATPSWSQLSSSPTISQPQITATAKSKEGTPAHPSARPARILPKVRSFPPPRSGLFWPCRASVCSSKKNGCQVQWCRELEAKCQLSVQLMASLSSNGLSCLHKGSASLLFRFVSLSCFVISCHSIAVDPKTVFL